MSKEYFIVANSFAAPFFSDTSHAYVIAENPDEALVNFAAGYGHPCGLYSAQAFTSADAKNKGEKPLSSWLCNHEIRKAELTDDLGCFSFLGHAPGDFEIDGVRHVIPEPKAGRVIA